MKNKVLARRRLKKNMEELDQRQTIELLRPLKGTRILLWDAMGETDRDVGNGRTTSHTGKEHHQKMDCKKLMSTVQAGQVVCKGVWLRGSCAWQPPNACIRGWSSNTKFELERIKQGGTQIKEVNSDIHRQGCVRQFTERSVLDTHTVVQCVHSYQRWQSW